MPQHYVWYPVLVWVVIALVPTPRGVAAPRAGPYIFPPERVPIAAAIAEGVQAARSPEEGLFWRWRRDLYAVDPDGPLARATVVTPYFRIARESYRRALVGRPMTEAEGRAFLADFVRVSGVAFPLGLVLNPAPHRRVPPWRAFVLEDAVGRPLLLRHVRGHNRDAVVELHYEAANAVLRALLLRVPEASRPYRLDLAGME